MHRLLILRHAKTERAAPGQRDRDRKLTARGRADAPLIGAYMVGHRLVPDLALVSPVARAAQTWAMVAASFTTVPRVANEERVYNANADTLLRLVRQTRDARALLLVGHNPSLHDLAVRLIAAGDAKARERVNEKLPTCGLVVIDLPIDDWSKLHASSGRLERFVTPRLIAEATD
jgi:phosphohistidine phosphatase